MTDKNIPDEMKEQLAEEHEENDENDDLDNVEHDLDTENLDLLDPELIEKIQEFGHEDMLVEFDGSEKANGDERLQLVQDWFTEKDDYRADTNLTPEQVYATTMLRNIDDMFDTLDLEDTQSWVDSVVDDFERYTVSIDAMGRKQEEHVLRSLFGDATDIFGDEGDSMFARMISNPPSDTNDD